MTTSLHRSPLDHLARKSSKSRKEQTQIPPSLHVEPPGPPLLLADDLYPESPILHADFRASVATTAYSGRTDPYPPRQSLLEYPPSPSVYSTDGYHESSSPSEADPSSSLHRSPSSSSHVSARYSSNYSRPTPPRTPESERAKREVLNRVRLARSTEHLDQNQDHIQLSPSPSSIHYQQRRATVSASDFRSTSHLSKEESPLDMDKPRTSAYPFGPSPSANRLAPPRHQLPPGGYSTTHLSPPPSYPRRPMSPTARERLASALALPSQQDSDPNQQYTDERKERGEEVYDRYSFYELPSPSSTFRASPTLRPSTAPEANTQAREPDRSEKSSGPPIHIKGSKTADDYLAMGIDAHMSDSPDALPQSAKFFEISANLDGGTPFGMLMWGLCLRHGWGIPKDEKQGFIWLRRACEIAVDDLEGLELPPAGSNGPVKLPAITQGALKEVKAELVLAIYEVGQCFFQGWGVTRDRTMGFNYFLLAARLGDMDAQQELGYCYSNGKGCKKDRKEAAKWYRAAVEQGASTVGLAWIYKEKLQ